MGKPFFVYLLICADGAYYAGHTDDLDRRVAEHQEGGKCVFTTARRPIRLAWSDEFQTRDEAKAFESQIKHWSRAKKAALIRGDFATLSRAGKKRFTSRQR